MQIGNNSPRVYQWNDTDYLGCIRRTTMRICSGAGKAILREAEKLAKVRGMEAIRLDCAEGNARLNAWYEAQGYFLRGTCTDGPYHGLLREKLL